MTKIKKILIFIGLYLSFIPKEALAATSDQGIGCGGGLGPIAEALCNLTKSDTDKVGSQFNKVISGFIGFMTIVAALWFGVQIIMAGYDWIGSGGDKSKMETAKNKITYALIGLVIVVAAWVIIGIIGKILGLDILNPGAILPTLL